MTKHDPDPKGTEPGSEKPGISRRELFRLGYSSALVSLLVGGTMGAAGPPGCEDYDDYSDYYSNYYSDYYSNSYSNSYSDYYVYYSNYYNYSA